MKIFASVIVCLCVASFGFAQHRTNDKEFRDFVKNGPKLFTNMDDGIAEAKRSGRVAVCWVSQSSDNTAIFKNPAARKLSQELDATTVQVAMGMNPTKDRTDAAGRPLPARLEFSNSLYGKDAKTAYLTLDKIDSESARKVLEFCRGGKDK